MIKWNDIPLKTKLISLFLILSVVPLSIVGYLAYNNARQSLESEAIAKLEAVGGLKESRISSYFEERQGDALVLSEMGVFNIMKAQSNLEAVAQIKSNQMESYFGERQGDAEALAEMGVFNIKNAKDNLQAIGQIKSNQIESYFGERLGDIYVLSNMPTVIESINEGIPQDVNALVEYEKAYGYYDLFLIDSSGKIFYTVERESDYGQNLFTGSLSDTNLAKIVKEAMQTGSPILSDFAYYQPSNGYAAFLAAPAGDGVVALQINTDQVNGIMQVRAGLGETGETYLVSLDDNLMRSDSRFETESTILRKEINTEATQRATREFQISIYPDYRGVPVVGAYMALDIEGVNWVMIAEIDQLEALTPVTEKGDYFKTYTDVYGYYDLFLINPDGH
ncbi:MAG: cache domain-containing protein, partial [Candidatus Hydrothermarchaeales archaeon]